MFMDELRYAIAAELARMTPAELLGASTGIVGALLLTQQAVFAAINMLGVYRWLIRKER